SKVSVSDEEQKKYYEDNKEMYVIPLTEKEKEANKDKKVEKKYRDFKDVQTHILSMLAQNKAKEEAKKAADDLLTEMSKHLVENIVVLKNSFDSVNPNFAEYGVSESFGQKEG